MAITVRKVAGMNEYTERLKRSCGHIETIKTLGFKMKREKAKDMRTRACMHCQLEDLLDGAEIEGIN